MKQLVYEPGALVRVNGVPERLVAPDPVDGVEYWICAVRNSPVAVERRRTRQELAELYDSGQLVADEEDDEVGPAAERRRARRLVPLSDLDEVQNKRVRFRLRILREIEERTAAGLRNVILYENGEPVHKPGRKTAETLLSRELDKLGIEIGNEILGKPVHISVSAYYDWRKKYLHHLHQNDLAGDFEGRGNRNQLAPEAKTIIRDVMATLFEAAKYRKPVYGRPVVSMKDIMRAATSKIEAKAANSPDIPNMRAPTAPVFYRIYNTFPAYLRDLAKHGPVKVRALYRYPNPEQVPDHSLAILQFDETRLPFFCIHETLGIPLGRPWLAWLVDERSHAIVGMYLGFSPPSDMVVASVLRHACSQKAYVASEYPSVRRPWIYSGIPKLILIDNSLQAHGHSINEICGNLDVPVRFTPARMPWIKGHVEGSFNVAAETWLKEMNGFVLPIGDGWHRSDYDPAKHAVVGFRHLLLTLHHWVLDYYHQRPLPHLKMTPHERWLEGCQHVTPEFPSRSVDLEMMFGIVRTGRLDHRGVRFANLWYYSDEIDRLRRRVGAEIDVDVKYNPLNLTVVHVRVPNSRDRSWVRGEAREQHYASSVDDHTHGLYQSHAKRVFGRSDGPADWIEASQHLNNLLSSTDLSFLTMAARSHLARAVGLSTAHAFAGMDHDGNLGRAAGALASVPLNPYAPLRALPPPLPTDPSAVGTDTTPSTGSPEPVPVRARARKTFEADKSLGSSPT